MIKTTLGWLASKCDTMGELCDNLARYPGMGFMRVIGRGFSSMADMYVGFVERLEWRRRKLESSRNKAGELAGKRASKKAVQGGQEAVDAAGSAAAGGTAEAAPARSGVNTGTDKEVTPATQQGAAFQGTIVFNGDTSNEQVPAAAGTAEPGGSKPAYLGTLNGPGQSYAEPPSEVPPDYQPAAERGSVEYRAEEESGSPDYGTGQELLAGVPRSPVPVTSSTAPAAPAAESSEPVPSATPVTVPAPVAPPVPAALTPAERDQQAMLAWTMEQANQALIEEDQPPLIPMSEREEELARLEYLSCLLRGAREPLCGLNGALVLVPLTLLRPGRQEHFELPRAIRADLEVLQSSQGLRFPTSTLLVGLEEHRGFEELVRRIGPRRAGSQRLGHRFDMRLAAVPNQLAVLCARLTGVFEDWVYAIFREHGSIARPGNSHLFSLLCQMRTDLQPLLLRILSGGFGRDGEESADGLPLGFSGCYFAATGRTEDRRAFVRGVFDKLTEEQNHVEWLPRTRREAARSRWLGWFGLVAVALIGIGIVVAMNWSP